MYFVISAGGTAGHINPALAVADELRKRGHEILFVGTPDHIEARLAQNDDLDFASFEVTGFDKAHPLSLFTAGTKLLKASKKAQGMFKEKRPDAVLTFGAYVSMPVGRAATKMGIPLIVHEQNSLPGMANAYLAKHASATALTYAESEKHFDHPQNPIVTGNPVRESFECVSKEEARKKLDIPQGALVLLVFGGSLGARHINNAIIAMKDELMAMDDLIIIHSTGALDHDVVKDQLGLSEDEQKKWRLYSYIDSMADVLAASDLVVSRAGASSLAEIMTIGVPAILVPYPYARGDHQTLNARSIVDSGAARLISDDDLDSEEFRGMLRVLLNDENARATMAEACKKHSGSDARVKLADLAEQYAKGEEA